MFKLCLSTDPFTTLELQNPSHEVIEQRKIRRSPDFQALKLGKDRSGGKLKVH